MKNTTHIFQEKRKSQMVQNQKNDLIEELERTQRDLKIARRDTIAENSYRQHYQAKSLKLESELRMMRLASFCFGIALGLILSVIITHI